MFETSKVNLEVSRRTPTVKGVQSAVSLDARAGCAKEAAAKAAGIGLQGNPQQWQITSYNLLSQEMTISYAQESFISKMYFGKEEIVAICQK